MQEVPVKNHVTPSKPNPRFLRRRVCVNCRLAGSMSLRDGRLVHWCLQRDHDIGGAPGLRPACADFLSA
ncbi:MAG: hypothetical protein HY553_12240 [Elusimicrobia bacterium]|nr:hypothetical protein [Elusimicrobiota bacterium]